MGSRSVKIVHGKAGPPKEWKVTTDFFLPRLECDHFKRLAQDLRRYHRSKTKRPRSVAVFGPPGSGKSHAVKALAKLAGFETVLTFNLSQMTDPIQLQTAFRQISWTKAPFVFFDEFDCDLSGQPLGWLRWFLAPMEDGEFIDNGLTGKLEHCIFFFGGGTASTFADFPTRHAAYFSNVKGPDFVSRLKDHINIQGPNRSERNLQDLARAILIRGVLQRHLNKKDGDPIDIPSSVLEDLLGAGRYRHGSRSIRVVVEGFDPLTWKRSADDLKLHVDGGPLEDTVVAFSAGGPASLSRGVHQKVAMSLLHDGARLIYGGAPLKYKDENQDERDWVNNYVGQFSQVLQQRPQRLFPEDRPRIRNVVAEGWSLPDTAFPGVSHERLATLTNADMERLKLGFGPEKLTHLKDTDPSLVKVRCAWALSLFRMREHVMREADAVVVMTGKEFGFRGRFPGIAEEVMLALAFHKPVYLVGGFGGATQAVGQLLGFAEIWLGVPPCLTAEGQARKNSEFDEVFEQLKTLRDLFDLPYCPGLPSDYNELRAFLGKRATAGWPDNGLTLPENRQLFRSQDPNEIVATINRGLRIRFGR
jgi:hypothetical protein